MKSKLSIAIIAFLLLLLIGAAIGYNWIFGQNVKLNEDYTVINIPTGTDYHSLTQILSDSKITEYNTSFQLVSKLMKFSKPKSGKYTIKNGSSNRELINLLRSGNQTPVNITFNNFRKIEELIGYFGNNLESDSTKIAEYFLDQGFLSELGLTKESALSLFIPNTYQIYWNISPEQLVKRFVKEHAKFWNSARMEKLDKLGLTSAETYTLASIVEKETLIGSEKPRVAGVYINRLNRGQLLQADPTVVYAVGDFGIRRVLNKHTATDSPYNTYKYEGLPPGPIYMPDVGTIDAVLDYENHKYLYFCAKPDNSGGHAFAKTLIEHNNNAQKYRAYLNRRRIYN